MIQGMNRETTDIYFCTSCTYFKFNTIARKSNLTFRVHIITYDILKSLIIQYNYFQY